MNILRLRELLDNKGLTGKEFAFKLGVSQNTISNIVNGYSFPKPSLLIKIAETLDVDLKELFISTKESDLTDPNTVIEEIKNLIDKYQ